MDTNSKNTGINRRDFAKILAGMGLGVASSALTGSVAHAAEAEQRSQDFRKKFKRGSHDFYKVNEKLYRPFSTTHLAFNVLPREQGAKASIPVQFQNAWKIWEDGMMSTDIKASSPNEARTAMAMAYSAGTMNHLTGHHGEGQENKGPLAWSGSDDFPQPTNTDAANLTKMVKIMARLAGADLVGICKFDRRWIYSETQHNPYSTDKPILKPIEFNGVKKPGEYDGKLMIPDDVQYAIVMGYSMNREIIQTSPAMLNGTATSLGYSRMGFADVTLANYIRAQGYHGIPCKNSTGLSVPMAQAAGLGQAGRNSILITPEYGPCIRLSKVLTNMPLIPDEPIDFGVDEFCRHCKKCARECPSKSITMGEKTWVGPSECNQPGVYKWHNDLKKCLKFWMDNNSSCCNCIAVCPFTKGDMWAHHVTEWTVKNVPAADGIWLTMDDAFKYGERREAADVFDLLPKSAYGLDPAKVGKVKS